MAKRSKARPRKGHSRALSTAVSASDSRRIKQAHEAARDLHEREVQFRNQQHETAEVVRWLLACAQYAKPGTRTVWVDVEESDALREERQGVNGDWRAGNAEFSEKWLQRVGEAAAAVKRTLGAEWVGTVPANSVADTLSKQLFEELVRSEDPKAAATAKLDWLVEVRQGLGEARFGLQNFFQTARGLAARELHGRDRIAKQQLRAAMQGVREGAQAREPGLPQKGANGLLRDRAMGEICHAPDFSWVIDGNGRRCSFTTGRQRDVMRALYEVWKRGGDGALMTSEGIMDKIGAAVSRLRIERDFASSDALGTILVRAEGRGVAWALYLSEPRAATK